MHFVLSMEFSDPLLPKFCLLKRFLVTQMVPSRITDVGCIRWVFCSCPEEIYMDYLQAGGLLKGYIENAMYCSLSKAQSFEDWNTDGLHGKREQ